MNKNSGLSGLSAREILARLIQNAGEDAVLCALIEAYSARSWMLGAQSIFVPEGSFSGADAAPGDPAISAAAASLAEEALRSRASVLSHIKDGAGSFSLLAEYVHGELHPAYRAAGERLARGRRALLVKELDARVGRVHARLAAFDENGELLAGDAISCDRRGACIAALAMGRFHYDEEARLIFIPVFPEERLLILGGGGLDSALAPLAAGAGFSVTLCANAEEFPRALERFPFDAASYILVTSRSYYDDYACLQALAGREFRYAGCLGSARKSKLLFTELRHAGWTEEMLARLHAPVGLPIGALDPAELAIAILAELIADRRGASLAKEKK